MVRNANDSTKSPQEQLREHEDYIERKINKINIYNVYWCLFELRSRSEIPTENILKNDAICKLQLIRVLKQRRYDPRSLDIFLEVSAENSIPLSYVKWFYDDKRAALWLKMVLKENNILNDSIFAESDITIFIHNIIFNSNLFITNTRLRDRDYYHDNEAIISKNKSSLEYLKEAYINSKVSPKDTKWLTSVSDKKINYMYQYMRKKYDIDNLTENRYERKNYQGSKEGALKKINKDGYKQALICADTIFFKSTDAANRFHHILASLDYWVFDTHWFATENMRIDEKKIANRSLFIKNMYEAWNAKQKRDRDKLKKNQGIDLTSDNKKNLKRLAKAYGKTQREVLNELVKIAYNETRYQEIPPNRSFTNRDSFFDKIPQAQSFGLPSGDNERNSIPEETSSTQDRKEFSSTSAVESVRSSQYNYEDTLPNTTIPSQNNNSFRPFPSKQAVDVESAAANNTKFIEGKMPGKQH